MVVLTFLIEDSRRFFNAHTVGRVALHRYGVLPPLPTETKQPGVAIRTAEELIADDLSSNDAVGDAIPAIAQRKIGVRKPGMNSDVGEAVFCFSESARPRVRDFQFEVRKKGSVLTIDNDS